MRIQAREIRHRRQDGVLCLFKALRRRSAGPSGSHPERPSGLRLVNGTDATWTHADHLGSPAAATDAAGAVLWTERYGAFGEALQNPAGNTDDPGFTGHLKDDATGLTYMQARYYDPEIGRFLSTDPIGYQDQLNFYAYVANDPVNNFDPNGEETKKIQIVMGGRVRMVNTSAGGIGRSYAARSEPLTNAIEKGVAVTAVVAALPIALEAGPMTAALLSQAGAGEFTAAAGSTAVQAGGIGGLAQTAADILGSGEVSLERSAKAAGVSAVGGLVTGPIPGTSLGAMLGRTQIGAANGAIGAAVVNGNDTTGGDILNGALSGGLGANDPLAGAAASVATAQDETKFLTCSASRIDGGC